MLALRLIGPPRIVPAKIEHFRGAQLSPEPRSIRCVCTSTVWGTALVSSDPSKKQLSGSRAHGGRILRHGSDSWVKELEVVEAT